MAKHQHVANNYTDTMNSTLQSTEDGKIPIEEMPLETMRDYRLYNEEARKLNKKLKICRYPIKQCPVDLHPKQRIIFGRNDQPSNPLKVFVSNHLIHFDETLYPGKTYDLPEYIVHYLAEKGNPIWGWVNNADGSRETKVVSKAPRFAIRTVYEEQ